MLFHARSQRHAGARDDMLKAMGWQPFFAQQISADELIETPPARVTSVHRNASVIQGEDFNGRLPASVGATVGDWVLYNSATPAESRLLERKSVIKRRAAGHVAEEQLIAANLDTAFIVTSCNADFNVARLERFIALAFEAEIEPVIVLTKIDLSDDPQAFVEQAEAISPDVPVLALNALSDEAKDVLSPWCAVGQTVGFLGSSGVGKSTLVNTLSGTDMVETQGIRESDAKGRHTTTTRHIHFPEGSCAVLDTPGMRELQLTDAADGVNELFSDIADLAVNCKFNDCAHETEPGCAIRAAIDAGEIDQARFGRWKKLLIEDEMNAASIAARRSKSKAFQKIVNEAMKHNKRR